MLNFSAFVGSDLANAFSRRNTLKECVHGLKNGPRRPDLRTLVIWAHIRGREAGASVVVVRRMRCFLASRWLPRLGREPYQSECASILDAPIDQSSLGAAPTEVGERRIHTKPGYAVLRESGAGGDRGLAVIREIQTPSWSAV